MQNRRFIRTALACWLFMLAGPALADSYPANVFFQAPHGWPDFPQQTFPSPKEAAEHYVAGCTKYYNYYGASYNCNVVDKPYQDQPNAAFSGYWYFDTVAVTPWGNVRTNHQTIWGSWQCPSGGQFKPFDTTHQYSDGRTEFIPANHCFKSVNCTAQLSFIGDTTVALQGVLPLTVKVTIPSHPSCQVLSPANRNISMNMTRISPPVFWPGAIRLAGSARTDQASFSAKTNAAGEIKIEFVAPSAEGTNMIRAQCTDTGKPCSSAETIINVTSCATSLNVVLTKTQVKPGETDPSKLPNILAVARDCKGAIRNNFNVVFTPDVEDPTTGFHYNHPGTRPKGTVACVGSNSPGATATCSTSADGVARAVFYPSPFSGVHRVKVSCTAGTSNCAPAYSNDLEVIIKDLVLAGPGVYIGAPANPSDRDAHSDRHYLRKDADKVMRKIIKQYVDIVGEALCLNDASLPWGGKFDYTLGAPYSSWSANSHEAHSCGASIDVAGKVANRPEYNCEVAGKSVHGLDREVVFQSILQRLNVTQAPGHADHYHLYLLPLTDVNGLRNPQGKRSALPCDD